MSTESLRVAGILLVVYPTVVFGGVAILWHWVTRRTSYYRDNPLRQRMWAAGHAHAGVLLLLSVVALVLVDHTDLTDAWKQLVRSAFPVSAILLPAAYFLSVLKTDAERPTWLVNLAYIGAGALTVGMLTLGLGLLQAT